MSAIFGGVCAFNSIIFKLSYFLRLLVFFFNKSVRAMQLNWVINHYLIWHIRNGEATGRQLYYQLIGCFVNWEIHVNLSGPLTSSTLPLWTVTVWSTLQSSEHQNDQTQKQFLSPSNTSHEYLILNVDHTTLLYNYLFTTHTYFSFQICTSDLYTDNCLYYILCFCFLYIAYLYIFLYYLCLVLLLSFCCTVELLTL